MQKLQFLLDTLLLPVPLDLINFSKLRFLQLFTILGEIAEIAAFAGHPCTSCNT